VMGWRAQLWMWCNVFWVLFLLAAAVAVRRLGIQRTLALALLLVALIFLGTGSAWLQFGYYLLVICNLFWFAVFLVAAYAVNPRRDTHGVPVGDKMWEGGR